MSAVWLAARGAVRRRRLQTAVIGLVVFISAATIVIALSVLAAAANPFGSAFAGQNGAHLVAAFDSAREPDARAEQTARQPGVTAAAGPFAEAAVNVASVTSTTSATSAQFQRLGQVPPSPVLPGPLTVVGRSGPGGTVDRLDLWMGHWATGPGQIVVDLPSSEDVGPLFLGSTVKLSGGQALSVVGVAYSASESAGAWVAPAEIGALHPNATQMLYRFASAATAADMSRDLATVTAGLPRGALVSSQSYLTVERDYSSLLGGVYAPLLLAFGIIALAVAVLMVANVISGAVVSGYRHIGVLKATGYTPDQVTAVYLVMVGVPALAGCVLGVAAGTAAAGPFAAGASQGLVPQSAAINPQADVLTLGGLLVVVAATALGAALRARRLPAARAISAGSAPGSGRAVRVQRMLAGARLPRAASLGLGLPFARPARTILTVAAVALGVLAVTMGTGLTSTAIRYGNLAESHGTDQVTVTAGQPGQTASMPSTAATETLLRSLPGAVHVDASLGTRSRVVGTTQTIGVTFVDGESASAGKSVVKGHWIDGAYQAVAPPGFLSEQDMTIGSRLTLDMGGKPATVTIVGEIWSGDSDSITADWQTLTTLAPGRQANAYGVQLASGDSVSAYLAAVRKASPGLNPQANNKVNAGTEIVATTATMFTALVGIVAALGVFNTVVLSTRERRRDLGMLKSIGMTPREVTGMMVISMAELGVAGTLIGLPLGILAHRLVIAAITNNGTFILPGYMVNVWSAALVAALAFSGLVIAILGAFIPARSAARLTIATVLRNE
ncbi:MAG TPA: ABC transporter permease [Trebonia sp.]|jgi:putative ABC transport system permease protein|nr:ABC transporter permease [Trebonia sp.]